MRTGKTAHRTGAGRIDRGDDRWRTTDLLDEDEDTLTQKPDDFDESQLFEDQDEKANDRRRDPLRKPL